MPRATLAGPTSTPATDRGDTACLPPPSVQRKRKSNGVPKSGDLLAWPLAKLAASRHPGRLLDARPEYRTAFGSMYQGDAARLLGQLPPESVDLAVTSPPYALHFEKEYGNADKDGYVAWFHPFAEEIRRVLKPEGSLVLNIGGSYNAGMCCFPGFFARWFPRKSAT